MLDSRAFYAGKTASNGTDRYIWGWCPFRSGTTIFNRLDNHNHISFTVTTDNNWDRFGISFVRGTELT